MTWLWWILLSNVAIFIIEYIYRKGLFSNFWEALPFTIIPILLGQLGLFYGFRVGGLKTLVLAGAVFTLINAIMRVGNSVILGEKLGFLSFVGLFIIIAGSIAISLDKM